MSIRHKQNANYTWNPDFEIVGGPKPVIMHSPALADSDCCHCDSCVADRQKREDELYASMSEEEADGRDYDD